MLILSRKVGETIVIGDNVKVTVMQADRGRIKIGIDAPADVFIRREELPEGTFRRRQRKVAQEGGAC